MMKGEKELTLLIHTDQVGSQLILQHIQSNISWKTNFMEDELDSKWHQLK